MSSLITRRSLVRMNTQNVPVQRTLLSKVHVTYRTRMSLDPGVSGDMVKVTSKIRDTLSACFTLVSRQFLVYQINVPIQSTFRCIRARTLWTIKSHATTIMIRVHVKPQVVPLIELRPTLYTRVFATLISVATSFGVWIANTRRNISRGRRKVLALITSVGLVSLDADSGTIGGHLANTDT